MGVSRSRAAADRLREVADPDLYRRNPFRVLGLTTEAGAREVRQKRQSVLAALDLGARAPVNDRRLPLPEPPAEEDVRAAFDVLERADHRIVAELFWWWDAPGPCGCAPDVHVLHDLAVEAHAKALDFEAAGGGSAATRTDLWTDAADAWVDALDEDGFWDHVAHRVRALSDRRLDESTVEGLKAALPGALLTPQALLARREAGAAELAGLMSTWDLDERVVEDARVFAATPLYERISAEVKDVHRLVEDERASEAARRAQRELPGLADRLDALVPHARFRRSAKVRNEVAIALNNAAMALELGGSEMALRKQLLGEAKKFATTTEDAGVIGRNLAETLSFRGTGGAWTGPAFPPGSGVYTGISPLEWQQVRRLVQLRQLGQARALLEGFQRDRRLNGDDRMQVTVMLARLATFPPGMAVSPYTWFANMALCFGSVIGVAWLLGGVWGAPPFVSAAVAVVAAFRPLLVVYSSWYRFLMPPGLFGVVGFAGFGAVVWWVARLFSYTPETYIWAFGIYLFTVGWSASLAKRLMFGRIFL